MLLYWSLLPVSLRLCSMEWIYGKPWSINRAKFYLRSLISVSDAGHAVAAFRTCVYICVHVCKKHYISFFLKGDQWARPGGGGGEGGVKGRGPGG